MANPSQSTQMKTVMGVSEKKPTTSVVEARQELVHAEKRESNLRTRLKANKAAVVETGMLALHVAETQASLFAASLAEGYLGVDRMKVGSVDLRAPVALVAQGYGLYEALTGNKSGAGAHALSVGNGVMGSFLASVAVGAGKLLAQRQAGTPPVNPPPAPTAGTPADPGGIPDPTLRGTREVLLTPEVDLEGTGRRGGGGGRRRRPARRFFDRDRRPRPHRDEADDPTDERE